MFDRKSKMRNILLFLLCILLLAALGGMLLWYRGEQRKERERLEKLAEAEKTQATIYSEAGSDVGKDVLETVPEKAVDQEVNAVMEDSSVNMKASANAEETGEVTETAEETSDKEPARPSEQSSDKKTAQSSEESSDKKIEESEKENASKAAEVTPVEETAEVEETSEVTEAAPDEGNVIAVETEEETSAEEISETEETSEIEEVSESEESSEAEESSETASDEENIETVDTEEGISNEELAETEESSEDSETAPDQGNTETVETEEELPDEETAGTSESAREIPDEEPETATDGQFSASISGIAFWGDELTTGDAVNTDSYIVLLTELLKEAGCDLPIANKTLQGAGTLSILKMAGIPDDMISEYVNAHRQAAEGSQLNVKEIAIRDLTSEQMLRTDTDFLPVILMGYNGGWNHDPAELIEQQEAVISTFTDQDDYIILAAAPKDSQTDATALDAALKEKWGDRYISLFTLSDSVPSSLESQTALAKAVFDKMVELGYLKD